MFPLSSPTKISVPFVSLEVNGVTCKFLGDSGVSVNIVSNDLSKMFDSVLKPCDTKVRAFNSWNPLSILGKFKALVESNCCSVYSEFLVVDGKTSLLGYAAAPDLGILQIANAASVERRVLQNYPSFKWPWKDEECWGQIAYQWKCETYVSIAETHPIPSIKDLEACVESLLQQDIIEPANGPILWVSPMVSVPKARQAQFSFFGFAILDT